MRNLISNWREVIIKEKIYSAEFKVRVIMENLRDNNSVWRSIKIVLRQSQFLLFCDCLFFLFFDFSDAFFHPYGESGKHFCLPLLCYSSSSCFLLSCLINTQMKINNDTICAIPTPMVAKITSETSPGGTSPRKKCSIIIR